MDNYYSSLMKNQLILFQINSLLCIVILTLLSASSFKLGLALGNQETDRLALLALKDQLVVGGSASLSSWNASLHFCQWEGVRCGRRHQMVISLELGGLKSGGSISSSIGNLTFLRDVNLSDNALRGTIPKELSQLRRLRFLDLGTNNLQGEIPLEITNCSNLQKILLSENNLTGEIPFQLGDVKNLLRISLSSNNLVGAIPSSFGNLTALYRLALAFNHLEGIVPDTVGRVSTLEGFVVSGNNLSGSIPSSIYNLSSMKEFTVAINQLTGSLPTEIDIAFPNLMDITIGMNQFTGTIPRSLSNISSLQAITIEHNNFIGSIPDNLGNLKNLQYLSMGVNRLGSGKEGDLHFFSSLTNCSLLKLLSVSINNFGGVFPHFVANLSTHLNTLFMGKNPIIGNIPEAIGNLINLNDFEMEAGFLEGNVPSSIGKLQNLEGLFLRLNNLAGEIPSSIGNLSRLSELLLSRNNFEGRIPLALGNCQNLQKLDLSKNKLSTNIPSNLFSALPSLILLNLSHNSFTGFLPSDLGSLKNLAELYIDNNNFSGKIPKKLGEAVGLRVLLMQNNSFQGNIPQSFGSLRGIENLDLSNNNLSGAIPHELQNLPFLVSLNLSFNQLEGEVPKQGVFKNASGFSFVGNKKLCGGIPEIELPKCLNQQQKKKGKLLSTKIKISIILSILIASISAVLLVYLSWRHKSKKGLIPVAFFGDGYLRLSYKELLQATQGFASSNLIGAGSFGSVYKGVLLHQQEKPVAVKVLNLQNNGATKSFITECKALKKVRHRNLVKIITSCSSIDYQGNDFKALVFDFMPNGSLGSWLHGEHDSRCLNLSQRLDIAIDVANAVDYLHHDCETMIIHCDLKPTNVLLDDAMVAHVGDFGLAKLLFTDTSNMGRASSSSIKGTIGYIAPEYGMGGAVSPEGDIYSYGIMLLEMITGRSPTDGLFHDGLSLHSFCQMALPERLREILDFRLLEEIGEIRQRLIRKSQSKTEAEIWECLVSFTKIGVACSAELPDERMSIKDAIIELHEIKARLLRTEIYRMGRR